MPNSNLSYKYVILGTGAGASAVVDALLNNGASPDSILMIDKGPVLDKSLSEAERFLYGYKDGGVVPVFGRPTIPLGIAECIGGGPEVNGALLWKTPTKYIDSWFDKKNDIPFSRDIFESKLKYWESKLQVRSSSYSLKSDYPSFLLAHSAQQLSWNCVPARRALINCEYNNVCAFGCPNESKVIPLNVVNHQNSISVLSGFQVTSVKASSSSGPYSVSGKNPLEKKSVLINCEKLFLATGNLTTPKFVAYLASKAVTAFDFHLHLNLKSVGLLHDSIKPSQPSSMFSSQIQEFKDDDIYIMPFNWHKSHVDSILSRHSFENSFGVYDHGLGLTTQSYCSDYTARLTTVGLNNISSFRTFVRHNIFSSKKAVDKILDSLSITVEVFRSLGVDRALFPFVGSPVLSISNWRSAFDVSKLDFVSVHQMASLFSSPLVNANGSLSSHKNIYVADGSLLPSGIGESPQLSIMAYVSSLYSDI